MARRRVGIVTEEQKDLELLRAQATSPERRQRLDLLLMIREDPDIPVAELAEHLAISTTSVKRWWRQYCSEGLDTFLGNASIQSGRKVPNISVQKMAATTGQPLVHSDSGSDVRRAFLQLLSQLSDAGDITTWSGQLKQVLVEFLGDVDRVSVLVNARCDLVDPDTYIPETMVSQKLGGEAPIHVNALATSTPSYADVIQWLTDAGIKADDYHEPISFLYHYRSSAYVGAIVLWRLCSNTPTSSQTVELMVSLESFLTFLLSDFVARHIVHHPQEMRFPTTFESLATDVRLTGQEQRVVLQLLLGRTYQQAADALFTSHDTIKFHLKSVYRKTGTHTLAELFAKYFTPRLE